MSDVIINSTHSLDSQERISAVAKSIAELKQRAYANAPTCGRVRLDWVTVAQAAEVFRISKRFLSTWASQGQIQSIKGESINSHRLVHIDDILRYLEDRLLESPCVQSAPPLSDSDTLAIQQWSNIISHDDGESDEDSGSDPASDDRPRPVRSEPRHINNINKASASASKWIFKLKQPHPTNTVQAKVNTADDHLAALETDQQQSTIEPVTEMNDDA
jgi:hypothetical protein